MEGNPLFPDIFTYLCMYAYIFVHLFTQYILVFPKVNFCTNELKLGILSWFLGVRIKLIIVRTVRGIQILPINDYDD